MIELAQGRSAPQLTTGRHEHDSAWWLPGNAQTAWRLGQGVPRSGVFLIKLSGLGRSTTIAADEPAQRENNRVALDEKQRMEHQWGRLIANSREEGSPLEGNVERRLQPGTSRLSGGEDECHSQCGAEDQGLDQIALPVFHELASGAPRSS